MSVSAWDNGRGNRGQKVTFGDDDDDVADSTSQDQQDAPSSSHKSEQARRKSDRRQSRQQRDPPSRADSEEDSWWDQDVTPSDNDDRQQSTLSGKDDEQPAKDTKSNQVDDAGGTGRTGGLPSGPGWRMRSVCTTTTGPASQRRHGMCVSKPGAVDSFVVGLVLCSG